MPVPLRWCGLFLKQPDNTRSGRIGSDHLRSSPLLFLPIRAFLCSAESEGTSRVAGYQDAAPSVSTSRPKA
jgi:hypothetical protein